MSDFPRWKYALVALVMLFGVIYALPNVFQPIPAVQVTANRDAPPIDQAVRQKAAAALQQKHVVAGEVIVSKDGHLLATFANSDVQKTGADVIKDALGDGYTVAFKLQPTVPRWLTAIGANSMPLGLDLQGGVHFLMQVDQDDVIDKQETSYADDIRNLMREKKLRYVSANRNAGRGNGIAVAFRTDAERNTAADAMAVAFPDLNVTNGPDTDGHFVVTAKVKPDKLRELFTRMGYVPVARHKTKDITVWRQGDINYVLNAQAGSHAARFVAAHGPCAPSMAWRVVDAGHAFPDEFQFVCQLIGAFAFEAARRISGSRDVLADQSPILTDRQRDCVLWAARGKTDWEISVILGVGHETVIQHLKHARERYGVQKRALLAVRALFDGLISFSDILKH